MEGVHICRTARSLAHHLKTRFIFESSDKRDTCRGSVIWTIGSKSICFMSSCGLAEIFRNLLSACRHHLLWGEDPGQRACLLRKGENPKMTLNLNTKLHCCLRRLETVHPQLLSYAVGFLKSNISSRVLCLPSQNLIFILSHTWFPSYVTIYRM